MSLRIAHLADLHFGEDPPALADRLMADVLNAAPDAVVVSGDLTRRAQPAEFRGAFAFLAALGKPLLVVPGNHDIPHGDLWARFTDPRKRWRNAAAGTPRMLALPGLTLIGLDTVSRLQWHLDWSAGAISQARQTTLQAELDAAPGPKIIICHHPLHHPPFATFRRPPRGAQQTIASLRGAQVAAVLCGHLHQAELTALGTPAPVQVIAPSALSPRGKHPNGWNLVTLDGPALRIETRSIEAGIWRSAILQS